MEQEEKEEAWVVEFPLHFTITTNFLSLSFTAQIANNDNEQKISRRSVLLRCSKKICMLLMLMLPLQSVVQAVFVMFIHEWCEVSPFMG